jgi:hypothetical protein
VYPGAQKTPGLPGMDGLSGTGILPTSRDKLPHTSHPEDAQHLKDGLGWNPLGVICVACPARDVEGWDDGGIDENNPSVESWSRSLIH